MVITGSRLNRIFYKVIPYTLYTVFFSFIFLSIIVPAEKFHTFLLKDFIFLFILISLVYILADIYQVYCFEKEIGKLYQIRINGYQLQIGKSVCDVNNIKSIRFGRYRRNRSRSPDLLYCEISFHKVDEDLARYSNYINKLYCLEKNDLRDAIPFGRNIINKSKKCNLISALIEYGLMKNQVTLLY